MGPWWATNEMEVSRKGFKNLYFFSFTSSTKNLTSHSESSHITTRRLPPSLSILFFKSIDTLSRKILLKTSLATWLIFWLINVRNWLKSLSKTPRKEFFLFVFPYERIFNPRIGKGAFGLCWWTALLDSSLVKKWPNVPSLARWSSPSLGLTRAASLVNIFT